jgi:hypothetical protein
MSRIFVASVAWIDLSPDNLSIIFDKSIDEKDNPYFLKWVYYSPTFLRVSEVNYLCRIAVECVALVAIAQSSKLSK